MIHYEEKLTEELAQRAVLLDEMDVPRPGFLQIKQMVERQQAAVRRAQRRQLALFILVAGLVVSAVLYCLGNLQTVFFAVQGGAMAVAITTLCVSFARSSRLKVGVR